MNEQAISVKKSRLIHRKEGGFRCFITLQGVKLNSLELIESIARYCLKIRLSFSLNISFGEGLNIVGLQQSVLLPSVQICKNMTYHLRFESAQLALYAQIQGYL